MPTVRNKTLIYTAQPTSFLVPGVHTKLEEREIDLDNVELYGGVLVKVLVLSSDPYMHYRMRDPSVEAFCPPLHVGDIIENTAIGRVIRSADPKFKPGDYVEGLLDFAEYCVYPGKNPHFFKVPLIAHEPIEGQPISLYLGALGIPGQTAFAGFETFAKEKAQTSKTMFVSTGAGPVGTMVIEYAKVVAPQLKIIASAGSNDKVEIMRSIGVDVPFNYKEQDTAKVLKEHGPIDIYWDNVAGPILDGALENMNMFGLIVACGAISGAVVKSPVYHFGEIFKRNITVRGFIIRMGDTVPAFEKFYDTIIPLVKAGKITNREHRYQGLEQAADAIVAVHAGTNHGKAIIIVADE